MTRTNENYKSESIQIKTITKKVRKVYKNKKTNDKYANEKRLYD